MTKFNVKEFAMSAVVPAVAINAAGYVEPMVENYLNKVPTSSFLSFLSSNAAVNPNQAKNAKMIKAALYTGIGLAIQGAHMMYGSKKTEPFAEGAGLFFYGLSGATLAEDPVINVPNPQYRVPAGPATTPSRQVVVRTANVIS